MKGNSTVETYGIDEIQHQSRVIDEKISRLFAH
jgi:hypothetical protein